MTECFLLFLVYVNVCPQGVPLLEMSTNQPRLCTFGENKCGPNYWCHLGLVSNEYQCCPGAETNPAACNMPFAVGIKGANAPPANRWYYDATTLTCKMFEYNGRKGNQNNFLTEADCAATCTGLCILNYAFLARKISFIQARFRSFCMIAVPHKFLSIKFQFS